MDKEVVPIETNRKPSNNNTSSYTYFDEIMSKKFMNNYWKDKVEIKLKTSPDIKHDNESNQ